MHLSYIHRYIEGHDAQRLLDLIDGYYVDAQVLLYKYGINHNSFVEQGVSATQYFNITIGDSHFFIWKNGFIEVLKGPNWYVSIHSFDFESILNILLENKIYIDAVIDFDKFNPSE